MKRSVEPEMMDLPGQPRELLAGDLRNLRLINRYLGCHRTVLRGLARVVSSKKLRAFTLLDVGTGSADIPEVIVRWARANRIGARIVALDRDPVGVEEAAEQTGKLPEITVIRGDGMSDLVRDNTRRYLSGAPLKHVVRTPDGTLQGFTNPELGGS